MIDRFIYNCFAKLDDLCALIDKIFFHTKKKKKK